MKTHYINKVIGSVAVGVCLLATAGQQAKAGEMYQGWNYSIDSFSDGSGGSNYEIKGFAVTETADSVYVALTGGTPLTGTDSSDAVDGNIGWGDMFFNFSGKDFASAEAEGNLLGVRFASTNDSVVDQVGLFKNVTTKGVAGENAGYTNSHRYYTKSNGKYNQADTMGTDIATADEAYSYLYGDAVADNPTANNTQTRNVINSGNFVGEINLLTDAQLAAQGLDFGNFGANGPQTFGFQLDKSMLGGVLPGGINSFMAHVLLECANDGVALAGNIDIPVQEQDVPEPAGLLSLGFAGLAFLKSRKGRKA
ncbi:PEP-CTERM sorting domain-containing protein [Lusitaniella coriacea LEGE 07157]|uniref:PEP-CTERM sorting domain-containing protein n=1 Tax=Lusitaniella coriacea LEGE 07157 TaxID=945747 RepID=A0A8J7DTV7_9CYAN|nr:XDD3 family exosortase-dependent surface protein [Lusitaniella coriacea]MBE9114321.1 PEP-CTERM sorting domain-containing protein [Lusitaniella coriacea LEGE 07157]